MKYCLTLGPSLAVLLLAGSVLAADAPKSGLQVGESPTPFNPLNVTGRAAGKKACQV